MALEWEWKDWEWRDCGEGCVLEGVLAGEEAGASRLLDRGPERGVTLALRRPRSSLGGLDERVSEGVKRLEEVKLGGLASFGVKGGLLERVKAALRVGVKGLGEFLSDMLSQEQGGLAVGIARRILRGRAG